MIADRNRIEKGAGRGRAVGLALVVLWTGACGSPEPIPEDLTPTPYTPPPEQEPESIGFFLSEFDASVRAWTNFKLRAKDAEQDRRLRGLEEEMRQRSLRRKDDLLEELESGPRTNRSVAAVALGFTGDPTVQGPLLAALSDPEADVVHNALLGLGQLGLADTPTGQVTYLLAHDGDPWVRNNAAFALQRFVSAGATGGEITSACRRALIDEEPGVRAQCAVILGKLGDTQSIDALGDMLYDDVRLVTKAAASALVEIGREDPHFKGQTARHLADALGRVDEDRRGLLVVELIRLAEANIGEEDQEWQDWAYRMP